MSKKTTTNTSSTGASLVISPEQTAPKLLEVLEQELKSLKKVSETPFKTNGQLDGCGNIKEEKSIPNLIKAMGSVVARKRNYDEAAEGVLSETLGKEFPEFNISGGTVSDWAHDINLRISVISYSERKAELEKLLEEGKEFITKEHKYEMYVQKLAQKLGKA